MEIKEQAESKSCLRPMPKVLVSCRGTDGRDNALAVAYCCNCSFDPPMVMVGVVPSRFSHKLIKESGCFVVNIPEKNYREVFDFLGSNSGKDMDKFSKMDVKTENAKIIDALLLADCPVNIECTVVGSIITGSHEMFAGKIEYVHARKDLLDEKGCIDYSNMDML